MRVAGELPVPVHAPEEEAEDDLADAVARLLVELLDGVEAEAGDVLRDEHLLARQRGDDVRHGDERVAAEDARQRALVLRLELVVELVADPVADLLGRALDVEPRRDPLHQPQDDAEVLHVRPHGLRDARVLDLDRDVAAVVQPRAVDLADRGGRHRLGIERREHVLDAVSELGLDHLAHVRVADLRRLVAQLAELALEVLAVLLGHEPDVEKAHDLAELHRRALHRPQRRDDLLGGLEVAALERGPRALVRAPDVRGPGAQVAGRLPGGQPRHTRGAGDAGGRDAVLGH